MAIKNYKPTTPSRRNMCASVWIIFDGLNSCRHIKLVSLEIDYTIFSSVSRRNMSVTDYSSLSKVAPEKSLLEPLNKKSGRNSYGRITVRHHTE